MTKTSHTSKPTGIPNTSGSVEWQSPANIALVKYWGKRPVQWPMNPSLSFVLKESVVRIRMDYQIGADIDFHLRGFSLNGQDNEAFAGRIERYLSGLSTFFPFLRHARLSIHSHSSFPHSAGIASSAAAFSALALCVGSIEARMTGKEESGSEFLRKASFMARLGSGSACRSLWGGMVIWGHTKWVAGSSDDHGYRLDEGAVHEDFRQLNDAVLIVDSRTKKVSSSEGHALMHTHPFRKQRVEQAGHNMERILGALRSGHMDLFGEVMENEALSLHSLMMSSTPGYILMHPNTILMIDRIRSFRQRTHTPAYLTLDAGPNIHLIYPASHKEAVRGFIVEELSSLCEDGRWIDDRMGEGPVALG